MLNWGALCESRRNNLALHQFEVVLGRRGPAVLTVGVGPARQSPQPCTRARGPRGDVLLENRACVLTALTSRVQTHAVLLPSRVRSIHGPDQRHGCVIQARGKPVITTANTG